MNATQYRELVDLTPVRPSLEDVTDMLKNRAYLRQTQIIFEKLDSLYALLVQGDLSEAQMHRIRGHIIALEEVLGVHTQIADSAKMDAAKSRPEAEDRLDGEHAFREALKEQKDKKHV